ncbi:recombinase family protein [Egbenema bharatensis]|uniref:recombinase family protein n=1 Tax=Egbenema bharatensis TaxID=3463334 RepID=UPI003A85B87A
MLKAGKIVAYGRVSSYEQAENQYAAQQQIDRLKLENVDQLFFDIESGNSKTRLHFNRMMELIHQGEISAVIATRWDRLTRNQEIYLQLKQILQDSGVRLRLLDQGEVDLSTASGELSADMQAIFAVHERRMLRERILKGHAYRRKRQVAWTRAPWGYVIRDDRYWLDTSPIICLLQNRPADYLTLHDESDTSPLLSGISRSDIAREAILLLRELQRPRQVLRHLYSKYGVERKAFVDVQEEKKCTVAEEENRQKRRKRTNLVLSNELLFWSSGHSFVEWVQNPVLRGHTAYCKYHKQGGQKPSHEWEIHYDTHPDQGLLTDDVFVEIQLLLKNNERKVGTPGSKFHLTGLVFCDRCGHKMVLKRSAEYRYYGCRNSSIGCAERKCIRVEKIDEAVVQCFFQYAKQLAQESKATSPQESAELVNLRQQLQVLDQALTQGMGDALKRARYELVQEIERLEVQSELFLLESATAHEIMNHPQARDLSFWHTRTYQERELLYEKLLNRILVRDGKVVAIEHKL